MADRVIYLQSLTDSASDSQPTWYLELKLEALTYTTSHLLHGPKRLLDLFCEPYQAMIIHRSFNSRF